MMIGERNHHQTVHVPPWTIFQDDPTANLFSDSPNSNATANLFSVSSNANANFPNTDDYSLTPLRRYLPSNTNDDVELGFNSNNELLADDDDFDLIPVDVYASDHFRMFEFKVKKCSRGRSHDWTECPYAHPGEKARRRDPRKYHYSGTSCPDFKKGYCNKGDGCEYAHGVFECWLHPARYRTQVCKDGLGCRRKVCFFAHSVDQLRVLSPRAESTLSFDGSPQRLDLEGSYSKGLAFIPSLDSDSPSIDSLIDVNSLSRSLGSNSVSELVASLRQLQLNKVKSMPSSYCLQMGSRVGSPIGQVTCSGFFSLPSTPRVGTRAGFGQSDLCGFGQSDACGFEEEPMMERVESGRGVRAKMFEKLSKENPLDHADPRPNPSDVSDTDLGWVSELVK